MPAFKVLIERVQDYNEFGGAQYMVRGCEPLQNEWSPGEPRAVSGEKPKTCYLMCDAKYRVGNFINPRKALGIPKSPKKKMDSEPSLTSVAHESFNWPAAEEQKDVKTADIIELVPLNKVVDPSVTRDLVIENESLDMSIFDRIPPVDAPDNLLQFRPKL